MPDPAPPPDRARRALAAGRARLSGLPATARGLLVPIDRGRVRKDWEGIKAFLARQYVAIIIIGALAVSLGALLIGLWRVPFLVNGLLDELQANAGNPEATRGVIVALAAVLATITIIGTLITQSIRVWTSERQTRTIEQGHVTDRLTKAIEQLGAEKTVKRIEKDAEGADIRDGEDRLRVVETTVPNLEVRLGAIYALERIAKDSERDHATIMEILCAYVRENAKAVEARPCPVADWSEPEETVLAQRQDFPAPQQSGAQTWVGERPQPTVDSHREFIESYFRENGRVLEATPNSYGDWPKEDAADLTWLQNLWTKRRTDVQAWLIDEPQPRIDVQAAATVIGRRPEARLQAEIQSGFRLNLSGANLRRADLSSARLEGARLDSARLEGANLCRAQLKGANLRSARLEGAYLREARLEQANLRRAQLLGADLWKARLEGANLHKTGLEGTDLRETELVGANLREARLEGADLREAPLEGADIRGARLQGANLRGAQLKRAILWRARLEEADLRGACLEEADLTEARLERADLWGARLERSHLRRAQLDEATLWEARLIRADLWQAGLYRANLRQAQLQGACLSKAGLEGADLGGAGLEGADLRTARLRGARLCEARLDRADLRGVRLEGTFLSATQLQGADLREADFRNADWRSVSCGASLAHFADFRTRGELTQAELEHVIGNEGTLLPDRLGVNGEPYYVWSCWQEPPPDFEAIVARAAGPSADDAAREKLRQEFLCGPDNPRRKTGTPLALEAPYPEGHPLARRDD